MGIGQVGIALAALLPTTVGTVPADAGDAPWRHGIIEAKSDAGIFMMVTRGFAEKQGLKLEIVQFKTDIIGLQALLAGEVQSFEGGPSASLTAAARGADVKFVGCHWPGLPHGIFVRGDIASVQDLKGKTFAISAPGASPDVVARALLAGSGVPASEIRFANLGSDLDRFKALSAGIVDATVASSEYVPIAEKQGIRLLVAAREILPNYMRLCIFSAGKTLSARRDEAIRFVAAEMTALRYALSHRDETLQLTREVAGAKPEDKRPEYIFDDTVRSAGVDPTLAIPLEKLEWMEQQLLKDGILPRPFDLTKMIDGGVRAKALELAGN